MSRRVFPLLAASLLTLLPTLAVADPGQLESNPMPADPAITGGQTASTCAWPTTVAVTAGGLCSGTLVHPQVVVYAAHCGAGGFTQVKLGESAFGGGGVTLQPEFCMTNPSYGGVNDPGNDWAFCKLSSPVNIPVTPPLMGCEYDALQFESEVAIAGFGNSSEGGGAGTKRWALTRTQGVNLGTNVGIAGGMGGDPAACQGDSGGPAFVRLPDGGWRTWGIVSTGTACGSSVNYSLISGAVGWIEENSGVDITPCFTADGEWDPTTECGGFNASEPGATFGSWNDGCVGGPVSPPSATCGPSYDADPDTTPPTVSITSPEYGTLYPTAPATVDIAIDAFDADWGIKEVRLLIDGQDIAGDNSAPYGFDGVTFSEEGTYELTAIAIDFADLSTVSAPVVIGVATDDVPDPPADTGTTTSDGGDDDGTFEVGTGSSGAGLDESGEAGGCACAAAPGQSRGFGLLALLPLLAWRRRR